MVTADQTLPMPRMVKRLLAHQDLGTSTRGGVATVTGRSRGRAQTLNHFE